MVSRMASCMKMRWNWSPARYQNQVLNQIADAIEKAQSILLEYGITGVHDFDRSKCFQALQRLNELRQAGCESCKEHPS